MRNTGLDEAQAGIKIAGRNINNLRYADDTTLMVEIEEELKSLLNVAKLRGCFQRPGHTMPIQNFWKIQKNICFTAN